MAQAPALPAVFVVDRDPSSLEAMLSDLSGRFGKDFTVRGGTSQEAALAALGEMAAAEEPLALVLVDDAASDFLARAHELHPRAKRVLLTIAITPRRVLPRRQSRWGAPTITSSVRGRTTR